MLVIFLGELARGHHTSDEFYQSLITAVSEMTSVRWLEERCAIELRGLDVIAAEIDVRNAVAGVINKDVDMKVRPLKFLARGFSKRR